MEKTRVICHMVAGIDGMVTGEFLEQTDASLAIEKYYEIHREFRAN